MSYTFDNRLEEPRSQCIFFICTSTGLVVKIDPTSQISQDLILKKDII